MSDLMAIYLFGSRATGHVHEDSDVDLAILTTFEGVPEAARLLMLKVDLATHLGLDVDLVDLRQVSLEFRHLILSTGKRIYCLNSDVCAEYEVMTMSMNQYFELERNEIIEHVR